MPTHQQSLLREQLVVLLQTESAYNVTYIPCQVETKQQRHVELEEWRRKICQWGYRVIDHLSV